MRLLDHEILVTGADGFIGSHLVEVLLERGHRVRAFVLYNALGTRGWLDHLPSRSDPRLTVVAGDIRDRHVVDAAVQGCGAVLHLAALIGIPYSYQAPQSYVDTNVSGTLNILQAALQNKCERIVVTSTSEVYGTARSVPINEDHPLNAQSPYAATKIAADALALSYHAAFGLPVTVLRPFNTYGPRQSARAVIPTVISQIARGERRIRLGALSPTRDFTFVRDTAQGFLQAAESDSIVGQVTNIGSGFEVSIGELARLIGDIMESAIEIVSDESRLRPKASEVERLHAGTAKAERMIGWKPEHGGIEGFKRGLEKTVAWFTDVRNLQHYRTGEYAV